MMTEIAEGTALRDKPSPWIFFALVFTLAVPFWIVGAFIDQSFLPGLPFAAFAAVCPALAAIALTRRHLGWPGVGRLLRRAVAAGRVGPRPWYVAVLLMPGVMLLSFVVQRLNGVAIPRPDIDPWAALALSLAFLAAALCEEVGWSGYATDPLADRWGWIAAGLVLGVAWALFHYVALLQAHRSVMWIAWWSLGTIASRVIIVWLYRKTGGSILAAAVFHATINITWQLYPIQGSYFDPKVSGLISAGVALALVVATRPSRRAVAGPGP